MNIGSGRIPCSVVTALVEVLMWGALIEKSFLRSPSFDRLFCLAGQEKFKEKSLTISIVLC